MQGKGCKFLPKREKNLFGFLFALSDNISLSKFAQKGNILFLEEYVLSVKCSLPLRRWAEMEMANLFSSENVHSSLLEDIQSYLLGPVVQNNHHC